jgi:aspartyl-tRNA(Asn)/glutamyl-tRNA(Gln) amidotransferase subunit C
MQISPEEVRKIAVLARLALDAAESEAIARDLGSILEHMDALGELDTTGIPPMGGVSEHAAPMREDRAGADPLRLPLARVAPSLVDRFFTVPRLAALDGEAPVADGGSA